MERVVRTYWSTLEAIDNTDVKVTHFDCCIKTLLNLYLPTYTVQRQLNDEPWITDRFRRLVSRRQRAWTSGKDYLYNQLCNQVNWLSKRLRVWFYNRRIQGLHNSNLYDWWRATKTSRADLRNPN
jgi:hypothetical protein